MSTLQKLRELNLPENTTVSMSYSAGTDVFVHNETEVETALQDTDVVSMLAELIATPGLKVRTQYGHLALEELREQGFLNDYERDGTFEDYISEILNENFYDQSIIEYSTEKYDHKRGFTTLSADVEVELTNLLENAFWLSSSWEVSVPTESGTLTLC